MRRLLAFARGMQPRVEPEPSPKTVVRESPIHGRGLFATAAIPAGAEVIDYGGELIRWEEATERQAARGTPAGHTFFFDVGDGWVIDGGTRGNDARWINHSCSPNCEAVITGDSVSIVASRTIAVGEELLLDYQLVMDDDADADERAAYACWCGAPDCRDTMLA